MLELKNINKVYNSKFKSKANALKDINLYFANNGCNVILGPSGCGKSTLLNIIGGLDKQTSGNIIYNSYDIKVKDYDLWRNNIIGFVFQDFNLISDLTMYENLAIVCYDKPNDEVDLMVHEVLCKVGLKDYENRYSYEMSGGEIQRVAIARALLKNSKILLADEPTGNLNKEMSAEIFSLLKELSKDKLIIIVTHNEEMANKYADRIIKMEDGTIVFDSNSEIIEESNDVYVPILTNRLKNNLIFKMSFKNLFSKKCRYIISLLSLVLLFTLLSISFSIVNFDRYYVDSENIINNNIDRFYLKQYESDENNLSFISKNEIIENNDITYILNDEINSYNDLLEMGYELYEGFNEISHEGIYVIDNFIIECLHKGMIYYDSNGENEVSKNIPIQELVNKYLFHYDNYFKIDGIIKTGYLEYINGNINEQVIEDEYNFYTNSKIFSKSDSLFKEVKIHRSFIDNASSNYKININSKKINHSIYYTEQNIYKSFDNENVYINDDKPIVNPNEIYVSLELYNLIFEEYSLVEYYLGDDYFLNPIIKRELSHIGEEISIKFDYGDEMIEIPNLIVKGIIYDCVPYSIYVSKNVCEMLYDSTVEYSIMIKSSSVEDLYDFISYNCNKYNITAVHSYTNAITDYAEGLLLAQLICGIIFVVLLVITILISINSINQTIKSKDKENGILRSIGVSLIDIKKIYYYQLFLMILIPFLLSVLFSFVSINVVDYLIVFNYSTKIQLLYFKIWYIPVILLIIVVLNLFISSLSLISSLKKNTIEIIRQN